MRKPVLFVLLMSIALLLLATVATFAQTNPCTIPIATGVLNPTRACGEMADYNTLEVDGSNRLVSVAVAQFLRGVNVDTGQPVMPATIVPRANWTLATGTSNCYCTQLPAAPLSAGLQYFTVMRSIGQNASSVWSPASNFFGLTGVPAPPTGVVTIR